MYLLDPKHLAFPDPNFAGEDGLLAIGGDLTTNRLIKAYQKGVFPWYDEDPILWWSPDPRFILYPKNIRISKSMRAVFRKKRFNFTVNNNFLYTIEQCQKIKREHEDRTWINNDIIQSYYNLHTKGYAHSVEVWENEKIVGGLYGIAIGKCFFGESMFSHASNASKAGFIQLCLYLQQLNFTLIDCQIHTKHLESLGGEFILRKEFQEILDNNSHDKVKFKHILNEI